MEEVRPRTTSRLRRWWPWAVGLAILVVIATKVPVDAFRDAIGKGPHLLLGAVTVGITITILFTDSLATWLGLHALAISRPLTRVLVIRGATYALFVINYALGQGAFGYYLNRTGLPGLRAVGVTLFLMGTNLATLLLLTTLTWWLHGADPGHTALWWTLLGGTGAFVMYLVAIKIAPRMIAQRELFSPLFDAGLRGHLVAIVGRLPHTLVIVMGFWVAIRAWGIPVPLWVGATLMPAVAIASVLPISPGGLGTQQAALVYFFSPYAVGATADERSANLLGFAIVYFVYGVLASVAVGLICTPFAKKLGLLSVVPNENRRGTKIETTQT